MTRYDVRSLLPSDFEDLLRSDREIFGGGDELGPYYVRLCCDFFADTCFVARVDDVVAGYLLSFVKDREAYCTTLAVHPRFQGSRAVMHLLRAFITRIAPDVDACWFTVKEDNHAARALHRTLGAREIGWRRDFYGAGDDRIVSRIDKAAFAALAQRYTRLGLVERTSLAEKRTPALRLVAGNA
jgi:ribosomal protein S18 acetylase RimI-like enzyme